MYVPLEHATRIIIRGHITASYAINTSSPKNKLAQNFLKFGRVLESTGELPIVEDSRKDKFWGAIQSKENPELLIGTNALGRLLMKLRVEYNSPYRYSLLCVPPPQVTNFCLLNQQISSIDERENLISNYLKNNISSPIDLHLNNGNKSIIVEFKDKPHIDIQPRLPLD